MKASNIFNKCNYSTSHSAIPSNMSNDLRHVLTTVCLIIEGRTPLHLLNNVPKSSRLMKAVNPFYNEGPHCKLPSATSVLELEDHNCEKNFSPLCRSFRAVRKAVEAHIAGGSFAVEVYLTSLCNKQLMLISQPNPEDILIEAWHFQLQPKIKSKNIKLDFFNALRSSLHFSQLASWFVSSQGRLPADVVYRVCHLEDINQSTHSLQTSSPILPTLEFQDVELSVSYKIFPRVSMIPLPVCQRHKGECSEMLSKDDRPDCLMCKELSGPSNQQASSSFAKIPSKPEVLKLMQMKKVEKVKMDLLKSESQGCSLNKSVVDDRMKISCDMSGKHHCRSEEEMEALTDEKPTRRRSFSRERPPVASSFAKDQLLLKINENRPILHGKFKEKQDVPLDCFPPEGNKSQYLNSSCHSQKAVEWKLHDEANGDLRGDVLTESPTFATVETDTNPFMAAILRSLKNTAVPGAGTRTIGVNTDISFAEFSETDQLVPAFLVKKHSTTGELRGRYLANSTELRYGHRILPASGDRPSVPSAKDQMKFRRSLDSATQLIFHRDQGLPPLYPSTVHRCFLPSNWLRIVCCEEEAEPEPLVPTSPGASPNAHVFQHLRPLLPLPILGSFEESVLHGRLEPVKTVQGFTAEVGANGSFIPQHLHLPVTVFFYSLCENDKVSAPYLAHLNLGSKGYNVPRTGTIQVTLFNPLKTVVKMFVLPYNFSDMPANSCTFLRQRLLYLPAGCKTDPSTSRTGREDCAKYSRYLIHLRISSSKSGKIYLHTDIRILIFRKSDADTAVEMMTGTAEAFELRAQTYGPTDPKYSTK